MNLSFSTDRPSAQLMSMGSASKQLNEINADSIPACSAAHAKRFHKSSLKAGMIERLFDSKARGIFVGDSIFHLYLNAAARQTAIEKDFS